MSIEPEAQKIVMEIAGPDHGNNAGSIALMSQAISLKRIADAATGPDAGRDIANNIYNGISTALFEAWQRGAP